MKIKSLLEILISLRSSIYIMKATSILAIVLLIVGLIIGVGVGSIAFPKTVTNTTTQVRTSILTTISPTTVTSMATKTIEETKTCLKTLTETAYATITSLTSITVTKTAIVTKTVTAGLPTYKPTGKIGEDVGADHVIFHMYSTKKLSKIGIWKPESGNIYFVIDLSIKNLGDEDFTYSELYMKVKDSDGREYGVSLAGSALTGSLPGGGTLKPGEHVRGYVAFEVPTTSDLVVFKYESLMLRVDISLIE